MENPKLHIPSVISQSCFSDVDSEVVDLKRYEINYFYLLLFLYREELLKQTQNLLLRDGDRYYFNELIPFDSVEIELSKFHQYGVVDNHKYNGLKQFIDNLSKLFINVNLFRKNKDKDIKCIKMIKSHSLDSTILTINFTKEFVKELIGVEKFFMEVDLTNLFNLKGEKSKQLYLLLKDYSKSGNKNLTNEELSILIGKIPQKKRFEEIRDEINEVTDIKISYEVVGVKRKTYKFKIRSKVDLKKTKKKSQQPKVEVDTEIIERNKKKIQQMKNKGKKFDNEDGYLQTMIKNDVEKSKPSTSQMRLNNWIETNKKDCELEDDGKSPYTVVIRIEGLKNPYYLTDDYKLTQTLYDYETETSDETLKQINQWVENEVLILDIENVYNEKLSKMSLIDKKELKKRGIIN